MAVARSPPAAIGDVGPAVGEEMSDDTPPSAALMVLLGAAVAGAAVAAAVVFAWPVVPCGLVAVVATGLVPVIFMVLSPVPRGHPRSLRV